MGLALDNLCLSRSIFWHKKTPLRRGVFENSVSEKAKARSTDLAFRVATYETYLVRALHRCVLHRS